MIAAVYARKSTGQNGVADEVKSVTRQVEHARAYAEQKVGPPPPNTFMSTTGSVARSLPTGQGSYA